MQDALSELLGDNQATNGTEPAADTKKLKVVKPKPTKAEKQQATAKVTAPPKRSRRKPADPAKILEDFKALDLTAQLALIVKLKDEARKGMDLATKSADATLKLMQSYAEKV